jgi:hypothetical protein
MEWSPDFSRRHGSVGFARMAPTAVGVERHNGVQRRVVSCDAIELPLDEVTR